MKWELYSKAIAAHWSSFRYKSNDCFKEIFTENTEKGITVTEIYYHKASNETFNTETELVEFLNKNKICITQDN